MLESLGLSGLFEGVAAFMGVMLFIFMIVLCWGFVCYLIKAFTILSLAKRTGTPRTWFAFIPFLQNMKVYNLAGFSEKAFLAVCLVFFALGFIPVKEVAVIVSILYAVVNVYVRIRTAQNFGGGVCMQILNIFFEPFVLIYLALSNRPFVLKPEWKPIEDLLKDLKLDTDFGVAPKEEKKRPSAPVDVEIKD